MSGSEDTDGRGRREQLPDLSRLRPKTPPRDGPPQQRRAAPAQPLRVLLGWEFAEKVPHPGPRPVPAPARQPAPPPALPPAPAPPLRQCATAGALALAGMLTTAVGAVALGVLIVATGVGVGALAYRDWQRGRNTGQAAVEPATTSSERVREREAREHALREATWAESLRRYEEQPRWHPVEAPISIDRVDLVGGTPVGRRAITTTLVGDLLASGGHVRVLDLTESATARDLLRTARTVGAETRLRVLPRDLHELEEAGQLSPEAIVDVLANVVHFATADGDRTDWATDSEILGGVVDVVKSRLTVDRVLAALRVLIDEEPLPDDGAASPLSVGEYDLLRERYGETARAAGITRRAFALANQLRPLAGAGRDVSGEAVEAPLTVLALDRRASELQNAVMASFLVHACVRSLRDLESRDPWSSTLVVCGAERLDMRNLERIDELAARSGIGLVTQWTTIPEEGASVIGRGNALVGFMRLGNAKHAEIAANQIGHEHKFVLSQLTENVSDTVTDTAGDTYTETSGTSEATGQSTSRSDSRSRNRSRSAPAHLPLVAGSHSTSSGTSHTETFGESFTRTVSESTAIGRSTLRAVGETTGSGRTMARSREFVVEPHALQHLPQTALFLVRGGHGAKSREIRLTDVNPALPAVGDLALHR